ncbi:Retrovirus-related polyprotein from transposon [Salix suchowensis]|nr:Retrovirus-related polyprotein from transposon [Salix suchowensis]
MADQCFDTAASPSSPPPPPKSFPSHPALAVSNINTFIKITLDIEKGQYITWSELFKIHARAYQVLDHILPSSAEHMKHDSSHPTTDPALWSRVDAIVLQWIYGTISDDLLNTILERDSTAALAWERLKDIFSDNKNSRALYLEQEFSKVQMEDFSDASSYCQHLKSLSDQLSNVGAPVSNERLVLQLLSGLTDAYAGVGSQIRHGDTLPLFYKARSMLVLEETARTKKAAQNPPNSAFFVAPVDASSDNHHHHRHTHNLNRTPNNRSGRGGGGSARGGGGSARGGGRHKGRHSGRGSTNFSSGFSSPWKQQQQPYFGRNGPPFIGSNGPQFSGRNGQQPWAAYPWAGPWQSWATPPCPYPTAAQQPTHQQPGLLGPRPPRPTWQPQHRRPKALILRLIFKQLCTRSPWFPRMINGTWTPEPLLT